MSGSVAGRRFYDRQAPRYDRRWPRYQATTHDALLAHLTGSFRDVLDVGCGTGTFLWRLLDRYPAADAIGIDTSGGMLAVARRRLAGRRVQLLRADARHIPLPSHSVDLCTLISMLHYVRRPSTVLLEARRVLRPGGTLGIVDYVPRIGAGGVLDGLIRLYDPGHVRCRDSQEISRLVTHAGFTIARAERFPIDHLLEGVLVLSCAAAVDEIGSCE